ncbi:hypothetical protein [Paenibacillus oryzisoli]|uniref:Capsule polysaccharide biosynthesis protein n=1 Tax=Paenibacillus oryzisoli TaxID=1850517 RepID=A0A198A082_9BACL|nr:hypothetical protein [Paenibacillus oryzisoli]OAS14512.1 hypothetical protein A8708_33995 [Paenibacillus oryzisoli]
MLFNQQALLFKGFLNKSSFSNDISQKLKYKVGFVVTPWVFTAVPWYSVVLAVMSKRRGAEPVIIFDNLGFEKNDDEQIPIIEEILDEVSHYIKVIKLNECTTSNILLEKNELEEINRLSHLNTVWKLRTDDYGNEGKELEEYCRGKLIKNAIYIKSFFKNSLLDRIVVPGGIYSMSGLYRFYGKKCGIRVTTFDSGPNTVISGFEDVAAYQMDTKEVVNNIEFLFSDEEILEIKECAKKELKLRQAGKGLVNYQSIDFDLAQMNVKFDVLFPLNIVWDAAALGKHRFFKDSHSWIEETLEFILKQTNATVAVRQHPAESMFKEKYNVIESLSSKYCENNRVVIYSYDKCINTYELLGSTKIVLPHTSTVGIEASILLKKVIIESDCYYSEANFVEKANTKDEYFNLIMQALQKDADNKEESEALLYYYFSQVCGFLRTNFTPQPDDFLVWVKKDFDELLFNEEISILIESFLGEKSLTLLNALKKIRKESQN